jgi:hypothetical protein
MIELSLSLLRVHLQLLFDLIRAFDHLVLLDFIVIYIIIIIIIIVIDIFSASFISV